MDEKSDTTGAVTPTAAEPAPNLQPPATRDAVPQDAAPAEIEIAPGVERLRPPYGASKHWYPLDTDAHPSPVFLAVVALITFVADVGSKIWAEKHLTSGQPLVLLVDHLQFQLARNKGGAWGMFQGTEENVRRPFFLLVSVAAIAFIVTLYRRLQTNQHALKWGLPLVLGGALGNVFDRVRYGQVIDFIDYRADWLRVANEYVSKFLTDHIPTDHWPTFNIADVAICVGVGLMAIDMFTAKRVSGRSSIAPPPHAPAQ